jgi:DNA-binding response OmpR family regulator
MDLAVFNKEIYELRHWIKDAHPEASVLLLAGFGAYEAALGMIRPGMDACGKKPITPQELLAHITDIDRNRRHERGEKD